MIVEDQREDREMKLVSLTLSILLVFFLGPSEGALFVLKNGNKLDGKFLSATNTEVQVEIASQVINITFGD